ncbi:MAG: DUF998 domain-containing protein, partial [Candidatus Lokiarchaeota archaeon]|nr:DUF998 domain-containing protein [Candidatus Lokiarchaeota archaeon]
MSIIGLILPASICSLSLYFGGIIGPIVFLLNDILGNILTQGYSPIIHAVSELTQAGSENSFLLSSLFLIAAGGIIIFGIGLSMHYKIGRSKLMFLGGIFLILLGIFSALAGTIFPMDPFGEVSTFKGEMHKNLTLVLITQNSAMIDLNVLRLSDTLLFKEPSLLQSKFERKALKDILEKVKP